jgi:hypothetical protein
MDGEGTRPVRLVAGKGSANLEASEQASRIQSRRCWLEEKRKREEDDRRGVRTRITEGNKTMRGEDFLVSAEAGKGDRVRLAESRSCRGIRRAG